MSDNHRPGFVAVDSDQDAGKSRIDDRQGLLGLVALLSLAGPALLIRYLLPDLNPLFLAALGVAIYSLYLSLLMVAISRQAGEEDAVPELVPVVVGEE